MIRRSILLSLLVGLGLLIFQAAPAQSNSAVYLRTDRSALQARVDLALDSNLRELNVATHIFRRDQMGMGTLATMIQLAQRGVKVRFLVDAHETKEKSFSLTPQLAWYLQSKGVELRVFNQFKWGDLVNPWNAVKKINNRLHDKIVTYDCKKGILGGRNIAKNYFLTARERKTLRSFNQFLDRDVLVEGPIVSDVCKHFMNLWDYSGSTEMRATKPSDQELAILEKSLAEAGEQVRSIAFSKKWDQERKVVKDIQFLKDDPDKFLSLKGTALEVVNLIRRARSQLVLTGPYFLLTRIMKQELMRARDRGVKIVILTAASDNNDMAIITPEFERDIPMLLNLADEIYQLNSFRNFHAKLVVKDDDEAFIGSMNFDSRSQRFNTESGVIIKDKAFVVDVLDDISQIKEMSVERVSVAAIPSSRSTKSGDTSYASSPIGLKDGKVSCPFYLKAKARVFRSLL